MAREKQPNRHGKKQRLISPLHDSTPPIPTLPQDLITEILSRLPVQSLLRFKCVCKSWLTLISNTQFAKNHLHMSTISPTNYSRLKMVQNSPTHPQFYSLLREQSAREIELDYPMKTPDSNARVLASCNGMILISVEKRGIFLWNPCTREHIMLPSETSSRTGFPHGFGYDGSIDDYKVVMFFDGNKSWVPRVGVYTLRANSWRRFEEFPFGTPCEEETCEFVNGALHWLTHRNNGIRRHIVSFDLAKETFVEFPQPDDNFKPMIGVIRGCLSIFSFKDGAQLNVWIMKEYGVGGSWTKLATLLEGVEPHNLADILNYARPLYVLKNGKIVSEFFGVFFLYDPKNCSIGYRRTSGLYGGFKAVVYIESLISPCAASGRRRYGLRDRKMRGN